MKSEFKNSKNQPVFFYQVIAHEDNKDIYYCTEKPIDFKKFKDTLEKWNADVQIWSATVGDETVDIIEGENSLQYPDLEKYMNDIGLYKLEYTELF